MGSILDKIVNSGLQLLWHVLHFFVNMYYFLVGLSSAVESYLISSGLWKKYRTFSPGKIKYLAVVVESDEAYYISKVVKLLSWLQAIGVKHVCLYDAEGVMKKFEKVFMGKLNNVTMLEKAGEIDKLFSQNTMTLELASFSDGKEAVVKAANLLFQKYMEMADLDEEHKEQIFTEASMTDALKAIGSYGPEPDLLLVYGPARCHLGFPAWRIRYTEILHMGSLTSMRYGSLVKALYMFTIVRQNYGK